MNILSEICIEFRNIKNINVADIFFIFQLYLVDGESEDLILKKNATVF